MHLSATGVAEIAKSTNLKRCPHTFVYIVYHSVVFFSLITSGARALKKSVNDLTKYLKYDLTGNGQNRLYTKYVHLNLQ